MAITTLSSREFNQNASEAKRAALAGPVFVTDRGTPAFVLLNIDEYRQLTGVRPRVSDALRMPEFEAFKLSVPRLGIPFQPGV